MATIEKQETPRKDKDGKELKPLVRYVVRYRTPERTQTKRRFDTKRDAAAFAATVEVSKLRGEYVNPADARRTVDSLGEAWLSTQKGHLKPSSYIVMETTWRLRVKPRWGHVALGDIRPSAVGRWITEMGESTEESKAIKPATIKRAHYVLNQILADAVGDSLIPKNPAAVKSRKSARAGLTLPKTTRKRPVYLTHADVSALAAATGDHEDLVLMLAYTGLRWGEAVGLRVHDLDLLRKRASVTENAVQAGGDIHVGTPKSHKQRTVPLPAFLVPYLAHQCEGKTRDGLLWPGDDGRHMRRPHPTSGWFAKAVTASGVPRVTPHDLRHTAASLAVSAGANVKAVQKMLGHASAAMTLDVYADLFKDDLEEVATALDAARAREIVPTSCPQSAESGT